MKEGHTEYRNFIINTLSGSAIIANRSFGKVKATVKPDDNNQILTQTDIEIGKYIINEIKEAFPHDNIIDEEKGVIDNSSKYTWVVDPIDGTSNFAAGLPLYGTMVGLLENNIAIAGGVSLPYFSEIYVAEKDKGAFCNNTRIEVTHENKLVSILISYLIDGLQKEPDLTRQETKLMAEIILKIRNIRTSGCVFDTMMLAKGIYGGVLCRTSRVWDNVAQHIIIEEAGGLYTDFFGQTIDYSNPLTKTKINYTFCAAPPVLHKQLQDIIHKNL